MTPPARWDRFARLIAGRDDHLRVYDRRGGYRSRPWPDAEPDTAYAVHLADSHGRFRVVAFDFDATGPDGGHVEDDVAYTKLLLDHAGARYTEVLSGPAGGRHLLVAFSAPLPHHLVRAIGGAVSLRCRTLDTSMLANRHTGALRPPGAPHRNGGRSQIVGDPEQAAELLQEGNDTDVVETLLDLLGLDRRLLRPGRAPLSPKLWRALHYGEGWQPDESLSELVYQMFCSTLSRGYDGTWLQRQLRNPRHALGKELSNRVRPSDGTVHDVDRLLRFAEQRARTFVAERPPIDGAEAALELIDTIEQHAATLLWTGRAGLSALAVLKAHLARARRCHGMVYNLSQRETAEAAGLQTRRTVENANQLLVRLGFLKVVRNGSGTYASTWQLRLPSTRQLRAPAPIGAGPVDHALFAWRALGKSTARVIEVLRADGPSNVTAIAERTGLHPGTVRRCLGRLRDLEHPLVETPRHGLWQLAVAADTLEAALDAAADQHGAWDLAARLVARHSIERQLWSQWLAHNGARTRAGPLAA